MISFTLDRRVCQLTRWRANRYPPHCDPEGLYQAGMLAILEGERAGRITSQADALNAVQRASFTARRSLRCSVARERRVAMERPIAVEDRPAEVLDVPTYLAALPERERAVIELKFWGGLEYREIGQKLGCTEIAAKSLGHHAIQRLRRQYG